MLLLTTTTDFLQVTTGSAVSTSVVASFVDITTTTFTPSSQQTAISTAATTTIVAAPAASTQRQIKMISVTNNSTTTAQAVTISKSSGGTAYNVTGAITLQAGEVLYYQDGVGFSVRDINGQIKETNITVATLTPTYVGYGSSASALTGSSGLTYSTAGNLVIGTPTSGVAFQATGIANSIVGTLVGQNGGHGDLSLNVVAGQVGYIRWDNSTTTTGVANGVALNANGGGIALQNSGTTQVSLNAAGNVSIAAPTSGAVLTATGVSSDPSSVGTASIALQLTGPYGGGIQLVDGTYDWTIWDTSGTLNIGSGTSLGNSTKRVTIAAAGNVTINAPTSGAAFTVNGANITNQVVMSVASAAGATTVAGDFQVTRTGSTINTVAQGPNIVLYDGTYTSLIQSAGGQTELWQYNGSWGQVLKVATTRGVTINAPTSGTALNVNGTVIAGNGVAGSYSSPQLLLNTAQYGMGVDASGNVFFKNTNNGNYYFNNAAGTATSLISGGGAYTASDRNLKTNITPMEDATSIVESLTGVRFTWKHEGTASAGLIAQDVEAVLPELVHDETGSKSVNYNGIVGVLVEALKQSNARIAALETIVATLTK